VTNPFVEVGKEWGGFFRGESVSCPPNKIFFFPPILSALGFFPPGALVKQSAWDRNFFPLPSRLPPAHPRAPPPGVKNVFHGGPGRGPVGGGPGRYPPPPPKPFVGFNKNQPLASVR